MAIICFCSCVCVASSHLHLQLSRCFPLWTVELYKWFMETHHEIRPWWLSGKVKTEFKSMLVLEPVDYQCFLKRPKGPRADWSGRGVWEGDVCEVLIWLHYLCLDATRWKPSSQWRLNKTTTPLSFGWQLPMTHIKMSPIHIMDLARPEVAGLGPSTPLCHPITLF